MIFWFYLFVWIFFGVCLYWWGFCNLKLSLLVVIFGKYGLWSNLCLIKIKFVLLLFKICFVCDLVVINFIVLVVMLVCFLICLVYCIW